MAATSQTKWAGLIMQGGDREAFLQVLTGLSVLYQQPFNAVLIDLYWQALQRFAFKDVKSALEAHISDPDKGQYLPKPADVVRYLVGSRDTKALAAFSKVTQAIRRVGGYQSVVFDDPLIHTVIEDMGGWMLLCQMTQKELAFRMQEFIQRYAGFITHPPTSYPKQLVGLTEHHNRLSAYPLAPPLLIGQPDKALAVYTGGEEITLPYHPLNRVPAKQAAWSPLPDNLTQLPPREEGKVLRMKAIDKTEGEDAAR